MIRVLLVDDHTLFRNGLKLIIDKEKQVTVVGEAKNSIEALNMLQTQSIDITLLDISMPLMDGLECLKEITSRGYKTKVIMVTMHENEEYFVEAFQYGAMGYISKSSSSLELLNAIYTVIDGKHYLQDVALGAILKTLGKPKVSTEQDPYVVLSERERSVLKLIAQGYTLVEIGRHLNISGKTVDTYKTRLMNKLSIQKKHDLIQYAMRHKLLNRD